MTSKGPLLVTGGAGYVGSHAVLAFLEAGYPVVVLDDLSTGRRAAVPPSRGAAHIVKSACEAAAGTRAGVTVFGADYATRDGTCVRDYIHVSDLVALHVAVLRALEDGHPGGTFNCGSGRGASVREVVAAVRREAGTDFPVQDGPRRPGDGRAFRMLYVLDEFTRESLVIRIP